MQTLESYLESVIEREVNMLPDQAPLEHFVHHNNLHHFEDTPFEQAVEQAFLNYGRSAYMPLIYYRDKFAKGEIFRKYFKQVLNENGIKVDEEILSYIIDELYAFNDIEQIKFYHNESMRLDLKTKMWVSMSEHEQKLWDHIEHFKFDFNKKFYPDYHVNRTPNKTSLALIPWIAAVLDQGQAEYQLADSQRKNIWPNFQAYLATIVDKNLIREYQTKIPNSQDEVLKLLAARFDGVDPYRVEGIVRAELNMLPGWAGMIYKMKNNREVIPRRETHLELTDYLLMRLLLNDLLGTQIQTNFQELNPELLIKENVFNYLVANSLEDEKQTLQLFDVFTSLDSLKLRRVFQQAFERTYQSKILWGVKKQPKKIIPKSKYQMFFCIDDRECSFRRYLEEISQGDIATFGGAGFFGLDMLYQKVGEPRARRLCPPAANPKYVVQESGDSYKFKGARLVHYSHSSFVRSATVGFLMAPWRTLEFKLHLYAPRLKRNLVKKLSFTKVEKINYDYQGKSKNDLKYGYTPNELSARVAGILKGAGLVDNFSQYILMIGHGHDSFNNPHVAAYRCGACSGANAYPNAKIFAKAVNDPYIRNLLLVEHNIRIPKDTYFIGGYHDTCNDNVELYDIDTQSMNEVEQVKLAQLFKRARELNARERCRKFYQAPKNLTPQKALKLVEERAWRIAEPRPELNHATNSLCIVGRRSLTKDLFLDRRAFLVSYDATIDPESQLLAGLLAAVIPVCAGINLEYYFSKVDTENYGSGSKTSHNVTGLFGVMNGIRGDLRTGLVWQMVEYHDPLRILFIIEATEEQLQKIMQANEQVRNLIQNYWISLALIDPADKDKIKVYKGGEFKEANLEELNIKEYSNSAEVPTGLETPVEIAYLQGQKYGE